MGKLFYSIGDVAEELGESTTLVRFWANKFTAFVKPTRNKKGNRLFSPDDLETLKKLHYLIKVKGMTLDGAERRMRSEKGDVEVNVKIKERLISIREELVEVAKSL